MTRAGVAPRETRGGRFGLFLTLVSAMLLLAVVACDSPPKEEMAARVNGQAITNSDVESAIALSRLEGDKLSREKALEALIDEALVRQEAKRLGVGSSETIVDERILAAEDAVGGAAELDRLLADVVISRERFRDHARAIVLAEALQRAKFADVRARATDVRRYYDRYRQRFSVAETVKIAVIQARTKGPIEASLQEIRRGDAFADAARRHTTDQIARENGGLQGWILADSLPGPLGKTVAGLRPGEVSGAVEGPGGWYLFKLYGRRRAKVFSFAEVRGRIAEELTRDRRAAALSRWLKAAREKAVIEIPK